MHHADLPTRLALRQVNRAFGAEMDSIFFKHVVVIVWWDGTVALRAYRGPGFPYDFRYLEGTEEYEEKGEDDEDWEDEEEDEYQDGEDGEDDEEAGEGGNDEEDGNEGEGVGDGYKPQLIAVLELPPRVVDLLKHVTTLDVVGHFDLAPPFPFVAPLSAMLDTINEHRPAHWPTLHKLRLIPDPFGRYRWRGTPADGSNDAHEVSWEHRNRGTTLLPSPAMFQLKAKLKNNPAVEIIFSIWCYALQKAEPFEADFEQVFVSVFRHAQMTHWVRTLAADGGNCTLVALETVPQCYAGVEGSAAALTSPAERLAIRSRSFLDAMEKDGDLAFCHDVFREPRKSMPSFKHHTHQEYTALYGSQDFDSLVELPAHRRHRNLRHDLVVTPYVVNLHSH